MNEQNEELTAEEYFDRNFVKFKGEYFISRNDFINYSDQVERATAELTKENEELRKGLESERQKISDQHFERGKLIMKYETEIESLKTQLAEAQRQKDGADNLLAELYEKGQGSYGTPLEIAKRVKSYLDSRLSSGETKSISPWISVLESLPDVSGYYVCWCSSSGGEQGLIHFHPSTGWQNGFYNDVVTHYMPIPAPPVTQRTKPE